MFQKHTIRFIIHDKSQIGETRREAQALATRIGFNETECGKIGIIITEAATNLINHGKGGEILVRVLGTPNDPGFEIIALDRGPGMTNVSDCMRDGYSTSNTPGTGLGAIRRLSFLFDLYSQEGKGTALVSQLWAQPHSKNKTSTSLTSGIICLPHPHESICGDAWGFEEDKNRLLLLVADGLGHGVKAAEASDLAIQVFHENKSLPIHDIIEIIHSNLRGTRGAAVSIAEVDLSTNKIHFIGIGNVMGSLLSPSIQKKFTTLHGTLGQQIHKIQSFEYQLPQKASIVIHSDGITTKCCELDNYPGLIFKHPSLITAFLYRDYDRKTDDTTLIALKVDS